jgi:hypothetical protein
VDVSHDCPAFLLSARLRWQEGRYGNAQIRPSGEVLS